MFKDFRAYTTELAEEIRVHRYTQHYDFEIGVVVFRAQPVHLSHVFLTSQALLRCREVYCVIGSANKFDMERNPFTYEFRKYLLTAALRESGWDEEDVARVQIAGLKDWSTEENKADNSRWGWYLYDNVVNLTGSARFAIFYSDKLEIVRSWFSDSYFAIDSETPKVKICHYVRRDLFEGLSATKIRESILADTSEGMLYLIRYCPSVVIANIGLMRDILLRIMANPRADTSITGGDG